jgi:polyphosphate kinase
MSRNFFNRVELVVPVEDEALRGRIVNQILGSQLADNTKAWLLDSEGQYGSIPRAEGDTKRDCQAEFIALALGEVRATKRKPRVVRPKLKPRPRPR